MNRRNVLKSLGLGLSGVPLLASGMSSADWKSLEAIQGWKGAFSVDKASDEAFWKDFKKQFYSVSDEFINLENGHFGVPPVPVNKAYHKFIDIINSQSSWYARTQYGGEIRKIVADLAAFTGAETDEILITRNATEAMNLMIQGLDWKQGDEVILTGQDYPSCIDAFRMLAAAWVIPSIIRSLISSIHSS